VFEYNLWKNHAGQCMFYDWGIPLAPKGMAKLKYETDPGTAP
jgi:hypothetical protein